MKSIYIYGASGHGLVVADMAKACGYEEIVFIDDGANEYLSFEEIKENRAIPIALGVGNNIIREKLFKKAKKAAFCVPTLIHPSAIISPSVTIGKGVVIMPNVVVNAKTVIKDGVILNTSCVVEHECIIEKFAHISPKVAIAGDVKVGEYTHIGIGSSVIQCVNIGNKVIVGGGSMVIRNIEDNLTVAGVPAKIIFSKGKVRGI